MSTGSKRRRKSDSAIGGQFIASNEKDISHGSLSQIGETKEELIRRYGPCQPSGIRKISTSKGCRSFKSVESGFRPSSSEISLPAPTNFPFGDDQVTSTIFVVLTLRMT